MRTTATTPQQYDLVIEPGKGYRQYWRDLFAYRELFYFLSWRDILVRYKQTAIGVAWAILRPLLTMVVFTVIFGMLARFPSEGVPYPILVYTAMLPWQLFSNSLTETSSSLINNAPMLTKIYFPRLIIPSSAVIVSLVDFFISFAILGALMIWYRFVPGWQIVTLPLFLFLAVAASFAFGLWLATLSVKYRDFRYVVPFLVQFGLYVSPVGFSSGVIPERWRLLYSLNPMVGVIDGFRWAILGKSHHLYWPGFLLSAGLVTITGILAVRYFRNTERSFADII
jgi:lipopolysaccharide transport system permease protein